MRRWFPSFSFRKTRKVTPLTLDDEDDPFMPKAGYTLGSDPFEPFRYLMRPLSGVVDMLMLKDKTGSQSIFLIGDYHTADYCDMSPMSELIENYLLKVATDTDFMIETNVNFDRIDLEDPNEFNHPSGYLDKLRLVIKKRIPMMKPIMDQTYDLVERFVPPRKEAELQYKWDRSLLLRNNRVHYLQPDLIRSTSSRNDLMLVLFREHARRYVNLKKDSDLVGMIKATDDITSFMSILALESGVSQDEIDWLNYKPAVFTEHPTSGSGTQSLVDEKVPIVNATLTLENKKLFASLCFHALVDTKYFRKCFQHQLRDLDPEVFVTAFISNQQHRRINNLPQFYFYLQRFFMDIYTCCRIMKFHSDPSKFKNVVIYHGHNHFINVRHILDHLNYEEYPVTGIPFNPKCDKPGKVGGSKKKRKRRTLKSSL